MNEKWKSVLGMSPRSSNKKVANGLVAVSSAAVMAVYAAGYTRTKSAADGLDEQTERRQAGQGRGPGVPAQPEGRGPVTAAPVAAIASAVPDPKTPATSKVELKKSDAPNGNVTNSPTQPVQVSQNSSAPPSQSATPVLEAKLEKPEPAPAAPAPTTPAPTPAAPAAAPAPAPAVVAAVPAQKWKDGTYTGWGTCRHGDIQASVVIEGGRILSATISDCRTRYSCNVIAPLPPEVAQRQSAEVDYVSGATQSTNAFYYAVLEALAKAK